MRFPIRSSGKAVTSVRRHKLPPSAGGSAQTLHLLRVQLGSSSDEPRYAVAVHWGVGGGGMYYYSGMPSSYALITAYPWTGIEMVRALAWRRRGEAEWLFVACADANSLEPQRAWQHRGYVERTEAMRQWKATRNPAHLHTKPDRWCERCGRPLPDLGPDRPHCSMPCAA